MCPRITDDEREAKRDAILGAAAKVFARHGYLKTRVADIADDAGVGKGTVYEYFGSKEEVLFAVWERIHSDIGGRIEAIRAGARSALEQLEAVFTLSAEVVQSMVEHTGVSMEFWASCRGGALEDRYRETTVEVYRRFRSILAEIVRAGQASGEFRAEIDPETLSVIMVAAHDGLSIQYFFDRTVDTNRATGSFVDTLCHGLCTASDRNSAPAHP